MGKQTCGMYASLIKDVTNVLFPTPSTKESDRANGHFFGAHRRQQELFAHLALAVSKVLVAVCASPLVGGRL